MQSNFYATYVGLSSKKIDSVVNYGPAEFYFEDPNIIEEGDFNMISIIFGIILIFGVIISLISTFFAVRKYLKLNDAIVYLGQYDEYLMVDDFEVAAESDDPIWTAQNKAAIY